jgi:2-dehydro-3-deoxyphosphogluconate aldolase/(4S)-4-hydroxy-2-oxoglutarate aldolase
MVMGMREQVIADIKKNKIIAIVRGVTGEALIKTAEALYEGGIRLLEVTLIRQERYRRPRRRI